LLGTNGLSIERRETVNTRKQLQQIFIVTLLLFLLSGFAKIGAQTYISPGLVNGTWGINESPFYIQGDITVPDDSTLIIEPGVSVIFDGYYALNVQGRLLAIGNESSPITFNINDTTGFHKSDTTLGGWNGIQFIDTPLDNDTSKVIYCTLQYGKAVGSSPPNNSGGAIFISNFDKVVISNCVIRNNSAGGLNSPSGGGLCLQFADVILDNNEISYNHAWDGGGIQIWESDPVFTNNTISSNSADEGGGGIWIGGLSNCEFNDDSISNNTAGGNGGGIICWQTTNTTLNSVTFNNNLANWGGGVGVIDCELQVNDCIFNDNGSFGLAGGLGSDFSTVQINNTNFERDTASVFGGAMGIYYSDLTINNSNLTDNSARVLGGGIHSDYSNINILNTTFDRDTTGDSGGGIFVWHCDLTVNDCDFNNNIATNSGGAISSDSSEIIINNSNFTQNHSIWGGGILHNRGKIQLRDCLFTENSSEHGGAINMSFSNAEFSNVSFLKNLSIWGGGIDAFNTSMRIDSCMFSENEVSNSGGGVQYQVDTTSYVNPYEFELLNSNFSENSSVSRGAIEIDQLNSEDTLVNIKIDKCEFINNSAQFVGAFRLRNVRNFIISNSKFLRNTTTQHTAVCTFNFYSKGQVYNCLFANNHTGSGTSGGVGISNGSEVNVMNCTFVNNSSSGGGGIHLRRGGTANVTNNIFWGNHPDQISLLAVTDTTKCVLYLNHNDIQDGIDSISVSDSQSVVNWGIGNIDSDPLFADTLNNDFHLQESSPCIAAGIDSLEIAGTWYYCPLTDLEGNPRPSPSETMPDIGAYENGPVVGIRGNESVVSYSLSQNFPNPFNPSTKIEFTIQKSSFVNLRVYDILGNEVETLVNEDKPAGNYEVEFNAAKLSSGVYFYQLKAGSFIEIKKMILLR
jgi:predicted outer membrane repeat protein